MSIPETRQGKDKGEAFKVMLFNYGYWEPKFLRGIPGLT